MSRGTAQSFFYRAAANGQSPSDLAGSASSPLRGAPFARALPARAPPHAVGRWPSEAKAGGALSVPRHPALSRFNVGADSISARARLSLFAAFPLHPQIRQHLSQYLGAHRPGERAAARRPAVGLIQQTSTATLGSSMGATETKLAMRAPSLALSSFWLVPLLPPMR